MYERSKSGQTLNILPFLEWENMQFEFVWVIIQQMKKPLILQSVRWGSGWHLPHSEDTGLLNRQIYVSAAMSPATGPGWTPPLAPRQLTAPSHVTPLKGEAGEDEWIDGIFSFFWMAEDKNDQQICMRPASQQIIKNPLPFPFLVFFYFFSNRIQVFCQGSFVFLFV